MQPHSPQEFDNTLKALLGKEAKEILPLLLPHTEFTKMVRENIFPRTI